MNRFLTLIAAALVLAPVAAAQPKLSIDPLQIDLGVIYSGAIREGRITLKNVGNQPLRILNIQPSCGCTTIKQPKDTLLPNESDVVEFQFNSLGFHGRVEKSLFIATNDPATQYFDVKIYGDVRSELEPSSHSTLTWFGSIPVNQTGTQNIVFRNASGRVLRIKGIGTTIPSVTAKADKNRIGASDSVTVTVTVRPTHAGYANERFWLDIDSKSQPRVDMRVSYIGIKP